VAEPHPEWFADLAHMNQAGGAAFAAFLRPIVLAACGSVCAHPPATAAMLAPTIESHTATLRWHGDASACTYDLETNVGRSAWRQVVTATTRTTLVVRRPVGPLLHARVRAHDEDGVAGSWSRPLRFRM
jgi:hypothetical protein